MPEPRVYVGPESAPDYGAVRSAILTELDNTVPIEQANSVIWLGRKGESLQELLHDGVKWVQLRGAGVDAWIAAGEVDNRRTFAGAQGAYSAPVAEHAVALLFAAAKNLAAFSRMTAWDRSAQDGICQLRGKTLAIVGCGGIGREVIRLVQPLGLDILAVTRSGRPVEGASKSVSVEGVGEVWEASDFIVLAAPATKATHHLIGRSELKAMRPQAWIINVGRGSLIDSDALAHALEDGWIGGAALDVTDPEPLPDAHPLRERSNCLITPHVANPDSVLLEGFCQRVQDNIGRFASGDELLGVIDLDAGY